MTKNKMIMTKILGGINNGIFSSGDKLPSLRSFAEENNVSIYTVLNAYNEMISLGIMENRPKVGYFVTDNDNIDLDKLIREFGEGVPERQMINYTFEELAYELFVNNAKRPFSEKCFQFSQESIGHDYFSDTIYQNTQRVTRNAPLKNNQAYYKSAEDRLATQIARWMLNYDCLFMRKHITMTTNSVEAIMFAIRGCMEAGKLLAVESPGHMRFTFCATFMSIEFVEIRSDPDTGLDVEDFARAIADGAEFFAILLSSCNSDPTGANMPEDNKKRLVELCVKNQITIIEYDAFGYLNSLRHSLSSRHDCNPIKSLNHESVIYISDFGRIFDTSFPIGVMESGKFAERILRMKTLSGIRAPSNEQIALSVHLITDDNIGNIRKIGDNINFAVSLFSDTLQKIIPASLRIRRRYGGPYLWVELPEGASDEEFCIIASEHNVFVAPGQLFSKLPGAERYLRVNCCATKNPELITAGARVLGNMIMEYLSTKKLC